MGTKTISICSVPGCKAPAFHEAWLYDWHPHTGDFHERFQPATRLCSRHAAENELGATELIDRGGLRVSRSDRQPGRSMRYPFADFTLTPAGYLVYKLLPGANAVAKKVHRHLPRYPLR